MLRYGSHSDGLLSDDRVRARMTALTERGRALDRSYVRRPERRVGMRGAVRPGGAYARPVAVKVLYHDRARGAFPNSVAVLAGYLAKEGPLFDRDHVGIDRQGVVEAWSGDRRVFHVIVSPNDGHRIADMVSYAREVAASWERRAGPLEWVASVESKPDRAHPEGNRHLHVMIRGVRDEHDLRFARTVLTDGFRQDAMEAATRTLGWMDERERQAYQRQLIEMERLRDRQGREAGRDDPTGLGGRAL